MDWNMGLVIDFGNLREAESQFGYDTVTKSLARSKPDTRTGLIFRGDFLPLVSSTQ